MKLYTYAGNNPIRYRDPFGLDTVEVLGEKLQQVVDQKRASDPAYNSMYERLDASSEKFLLISTELEPSNPANDPGFTGFATDNQYREEVISHVLPDDYHKYWQEGAAGAALINPSTRDPGGTVGHETAHLVGVLEIGRSTSIRTRLHCGTYSQSPSTNYGVREG